MKNTNGFNVMVLKAKDQRLWKIHSFNLEDAFGSWVRGNKYSLNIIIARI